MLKSGPLPTNRLPLQPLYPHRGLKYAPLSEPARQDYERDVSPQNPGKVPGSCVKTAARVASEAKSPALAVMDFFYQSAGLEINLHRRVLELKITC